MNNIWNFSFQTKKLQEGKKKKMFLLGRLMLVLRTLSVFVEASYVIRGGDGSKLN